MKTRHNSEIMGIPKMERLHLSLLAPFPYRTLPVDACKLNNLVVRQARIQFAASLLSSHLCPGIMKDPHMTKVRVTFHQGGLEAELIH